MKLYFAPLEGITYYQFRNIHAEIFGDVDAYYAPFISPGKDTHMTAKERQDVLPENQTVPELVPQIMCNHPDAFAGVAKELYEMGYHEMNINLGCPSGTVVAKKKGAGLLEDPFLLDRLFQNIYEKELFASGKMQLSVKTRLGLREEWEFEDLLAVYNKYPLKELIVHARVREDYYKKPVRLDCFTQAYENSKHKLCYNGDIFRKEDYDKIMERYPNLDAIMLGRGILFNPALARVIKGGEQISREELIAYYEALLTLYKETQNGERNLVFRLKELWFYLGPLFKDAEKELKTLRKTDRFAEFHTTARMILRKKELQPDKRPVL